MNPKIQRFFDQMDPGAPEFYFHSKHRTFLFKQTGSEDGVQNWVELDYTMASSMLAKKGFDRTKDKRSQMSEVDNMLVEKMDDSSKSCQYCGAVGGYYKGFGKLGGMNALVTESPAVPKSVKGDCSHILAIINGLFGTRGGIQIPYVLAWLKLSREMLLSENRRGMQALILVGEADCGKSFFQEHIVNQFFGRHVDATNYIAKGTTRFNGDIFSAEHLKVSDPELSTATSARRGLGERIKGIVANETQGMERKFQDSISLLPYSRMTMSINDEEANVMGLPIMDKNMRDKVFLFWCQQFEWPVYALTTAEKEAFKNQVYAQIPAFCWWLENEFTIPLSMMINPATKKPARFGINHYHDPRILRKLIEVSPSFRLLELIQQCLLLRPESATGRVKVSDESELQMSALDLEMALKSDDSPVRHEARALIGTGTALARHLGSLHHDFPENVFERRTSKKRLWVLRDIAQIIESIDDAETEGAQ